MRSISKAGMIWRPLHCMARCRRQVGVALALAGIYIAVPSAAGEMRTCTETLATFSKSARIEADGRKVRASACANLSNAEGTVLLALDVDSIVRIYVLANDTDADGDALTANVVTNPLHGKLVRNDDGSFTYTPDHDWFGTDRFTYQANDGTASSNVATVVLIVRAVNDAPVAKSASYTLQQDGRITLDLRGLVSDVDGDALTIGVANPANGSLTKNVDGTYTYAARAGFVGGDGFSYTVSDGKTVATGTISLAVQAMQLSAALAPAGGNASVIVTSNGGGVNSATPSVRYAVVNSVSGASPSGTGTMAVDWQGLNSGAANVGALMPDPGKNWLGQQLLAGKVDEKESLAETTGLRILL